MAFGGWATTSQLLEREFVDKRQALKADDVATATSYAQLIPGGTQTSIVSGVGYQLRGSPGSLVATVFYLIPATTIILVFAIVYFNLPTNSQLNDYFGPIRAVLVGIILANAYRIARSHASRKLFWWLVALSFVAKMFLGINAAFIILGFAAVGILLSILKERGQ